MEASDSPVAPVQDSQDVEFGLWMLVSLRHGRARGRGGGQNVGSREVHMSNRGPPIENPDSHGSQAKKTWTTCGGMRGGSRGGHLGSLIVSHYSLLLEATKVQYELMSSDSEPDMLMSFDPMPDAHLTAPDRLNGSDLKPLTLALLSQTPRAP